MFIVMDSNEPNTLYGVHYFIAYDKADRANVLKDALNHRDRINAKRKRAHQTVYVYELSQPELES